MYLSHYGLTRKPFEISPDPDFMWLGEKHREGLAILQYGVLENKGFLLITGDVGTGKTALIRAIEREIGAHSIPVTIPDPGMNLMDFYNYMASELKLGRSFTNKGEFLIHFKRFLLENFSAHKRVLLIIDEAQRVTHDLLEEIRLLSNIDLGSQVLINIFLVGQSEFRTFLTQDENRSLRQRISVSYHIAPLTEEETRAYLKHRLLVAGTTHEIFPPEASRAVYRHTRGYPRLINILCDHAMMSGYAIGVATLNPDIIAECADELRIAIGEDLPGAVESAPHENTPPQAATPPSPAANPHPRKARSALILAAFISIVVAGWYVWGDAIADKLAGFGNRSEHREAKDTSPRLEKKSQPAESASAESREDAPRTTVRPPAPMTAPATPLAPAATPSARPTPPAASALPSPAKPAEWQNQEFTVYFTQGSAEVPLYAQDVLSVATNLLNDFPDAVAVIEGHTDSIGDPSFNKTISELRTVAVKNYFVGKGIAPIRIRTVGLGSEKPIGSNNTSEGRSRNRRVVIRVVAPTQG
jgi:general secretion pathway protein A